MSRAQTLFAVALLGITVLVVLVAVYVLSSPAWSDRWYRRRRR